MLENFVPIQLSKIRIYGPRNARAWPSTHRAFAKLPTSTHKPNSRGDRDYSLVQLYTIQIIYHNMNKKINMIHFKSNSLVSTNSALFLEASLLN